MFTDTDVVRTTALGDFDHPQVTCGIRADNCYIVDVKRGVLPHVPYMHPTRVFHKGVDRKPELTAMRICELIAPHIAIPMAPDNREKSPGVYMRFIRGKQMMLRARYTPQHRYDLGCIAVLDALTGNSDRHTGNAMVTKSHVHPIDHGACFSYGVLNKRISLFEPQASGSMKNKHVFDGVTATLARVYEYADDVAALLFKGDLRFTGEDVREWTKNVRKEAEVDRARKERVW